MEGGEGGRMSSPGVQTRRPPPRPERRASVEQGGREEVASPRGEHRERKKSSTKHLESPRSKETKETGEAKEARETSSAGSRRSSHSSKGRKMSR